MNYGKTNVNNKPVLLTDDNIYCVGGGRLLSDIIYPIGSIYLSVASTNPSEYFGGTWEQIAKGCTLVGVDTNDADFNIVKKTGGEKTHALTVAEMPSHKHTLLYNQNIPANNNVFIPYGSANNIRIGGDNRAVENTGGNQPHNNMPPYFTCYMWRRIS